MVNSNAEQILGRALEENQYEDFPFISIIIPFFWKRLNYLKQFLQYASSLDYDKFEILIVTHKLIDLELPPNARVIVTDTVSQGDKLDLGVLQSKGSICAIVGDDTYPDTQWLRNAVKYFLDPEIIAVGGPGLTPPDDSALQKASGWVYESFFATGPTRFRHSVAKARECDDLPGTNLLVRRDSILAVGGFKLPFRSGEDTHLCSKLVKLGKRMIYAPDVRVYHHRRNLMRGYLRQIWNVGLHRAYFAKEFGSISRRPIYFIPLIVLFALPLLFYAMITNFWFGLFVVGAFALISLIEAARSYAELQNFKAAIYVPLAIWLTPLTYGAAFLRGLLLPKNSNVLFYSE